MSQKKKILVFYLGRRGGGPVYTYEIACALSKRANVSVVLSLYIENKDIWDKEAEKNKNLNVKYVKTYKSILGFIFSYLNIFRFIEIIRIINLYKPDMFYSPMGHFWDVIIYPFVKCKLKIKTIHDVEPQKEDGVGTRFLHFFSCRQADKYIILSRKYTQNLINAGLNKHNIIYMPHAAYCSYGGKSVGSNFKLNNKILFFGRILKYKGLNVLLQAMKIVVENMPDMKLVIAGDGDISLYKKDIDILRKNIELHNKWISIKDVKIYFDKIDAVVLPYIQASQSGVIPLSYAFSKPVIVSDAGALDEQVYDGKTGYLVKSNNPEMLAEKILRFMKSPDLALKMSKECYKVYKNELTWDASAEKLMECLSN
jgi:glycosyltransferase involved in cell wall biosynthesis